MRSLFFSGVWFYGAAGLLLLGMALRQPALSILAFLTLLTAASSRLWGQHALDHIEYERRLSARRVFPGESVEVMPVLSIPTG